MTSRISTLAVSTCENIDLANAACQIIHITVRSEFETATSLYYAANRTAAHFSTAARAGFTMNGHLP
jgi:hypothetical protein